MFRSMFSIALLLLIFDAQAAFSQVIVSVTEPFETSQIAAVEPGVIQKIHVHEGKTIEAGEILADLDKGVLLESRKLAELRSKAEAKIKAARSELTLREIQKRNFDSLIEKGHANPFETDQADAKYAQAVAEYEGAVEEQELRRAELSKIDKEIERRTIRSPISGVIIEIHKRPGEFVSATDPQFATVVQLNRLRARFYLKSEDARNLTNGQSMTVYIGQQQAAVEGTVEYVSPIVEPKTGLARVNILLQNENLEFQSGIICSLEKVNFQMRQTGFSNIPAANKTP